VIKGIEAVARDINRNFPGEMSFDKKIPPTIET
jgi:hypothetical protein